MPRQRGRLAGRAPTAGTALQVPTASSSSHRRSADRVSACGTVHSNPIRLAEADRLPPGALGGRLGAARSAATSPRSSPRRRARRQDSNLRAPMAATPKIWVPGDSSVERPSAIVEAPGGSWSRGMNVTRSSAGPVSAHAGRVASALNLRARSAATAFCPLRRVISRRTTCSNRAAPWRRVLRRDHRPRPSPRPRFGAGSGCSERPSWLAISTMSCSRRAPGTGADPRRIERLRDIPAARPLSGPASAAPESHARHRTSYRPAPAHRGRRPRPSACCRPGRSHDRVGPRHQFPRPRQSRVAIAITPGHATAVAHERPPPVMGHEAAAHREDVPTPEPSAEVPGRGRARDQVRAQRVQVRGVVPQPFDVLQPGPTARHVVGQVQDLVGLVVRQWQVHFQQIQAPSIARGQAQLGHQPVQGR